MFAEHSPFYNHDYPDHDGIKRELGRAQAASVPRKDTVAVEKQDLESWYRALSDQYASGEDLDDLRDSIYRYLR